MIRAKVRGQTSADTPSYPDLSLVFHLSSQLVRVTKKTQRVPRSEEPYFSFWSMELLEVSEH